MASRKHSRPLSNMPKVAAARERRQGLTGDEAELLRRDNNDRKAKHDCLKKLSTSDIW
jgi:hypothetical protein